MAGLTNAAQPTLLKEIVSVKGHTLVKEGDIAVFVKEAAFSPDGRKAATVADNGTVKVWKIPSLKEMSHFEVERDLFPRIAMAWSPDSRFLAVSGSKPSVGSDGKIRRLEHYGRVWVWGPDGKLRRAIQHPGPVFRVYFRPDGSGLSAGLGPTFLWAEEMADDLQRFLDGKPILGCKSRAKNISIGSQGLRRIAEFRGATTRSSSRRALLPVPRNSQLRSSALLRLEMFLARLRRRSRGEGRLQRLRYGGGVDVLRAQRS